MPLPRCPACGSLIFPSAREGGDVSPLCESCQTEVKRTGRALGPSLRFASPEVHEEVVEPSGPFLLPDTLPPDEVLDHLGTRRPEAPVDEVVVEPSGPFVLPGRAPIPEAASMLAGDEAAAPEPEPVPVPAEEAEEVVEPSGPFLVPSAAGAAAPPVSLEAAGDKTDAYLHPGPEAVMSGVTRGAPKHAAQDPAAGPSIVVDPTLGRRGEATIELPRDRAAGLGLPTSARTSWTALALAFTAGMLAGAALTIAILRL